MSPHSLEGLRVRGVLEAPLEHPHRHTRLYECQQCDRGFAWRSSLHKHLKIHTERESERKRRREREREREEETERRRDGERERRREREREREEEEASKVGRRPFQSRLDAAVYSRHLQP
ncbi:unnamed protein product, partial [Arctogadus glacialis]